MRRELILAATAVLGCSLISSAVAEDNRTGGLPQGKQAAAKADTMTRTDLRVKIHRVTADLIEALAAEKPDQAKIDQLTAELQQLRGKLRRLAPVAVAGNQPAVWNCPWGGPPMAFGRGPAWGGQGRGPGRGAGLGPGFGRGPGGGAGRGWGPGGGLGLAPGGPAFSDQDDDGICDNYELRHGMHK